MAQASNLEWGVMIPGRTSTPSEGRAQSYARIGDSNLQKIKTFSNGTTIRFGPDDPVDEFEQNHPFYEQILQIDGTLNDILQQNVRQVWDANNVFANFRSETKARDPSNSVKYNNMLYFQTPSRYASLTLSSSIYNNEHGRPRPGAAHPGDSDTRFGVIDEDTHREVKLRQCTSITGRQPTTLDRGHRGRATTDREDKYYNAQVDSRKFQGGYSNFMATRYDRRSFSTPSHQVHRRRGIRAERGGFSVSRRGSSTSAGRYRGNGHDQDAGNSYLESGINPIDVRNAERDIERDEQEMQRDSSGRSQLFRLTPQNDFKQTQDNFYQQHNQRRPGSQTAVLPYLASAEKYQFSSSLQKDIPTQSKASSMYETPLQSQIVSRYLPPKREHLSASLYQSRPIQEQGVYIDPTYSSSQQYSQHLEHKNWLSQSYPEHAKVWSGQPASFPKVLAGNVTHDSLLHSRESRAQGKEFVGRTMSVMGDNPKLGSTGLSPGDRAFADAYFGGHSNLADSLHTIPYEVREISLNTNLIGSRSFGSGPSASHGRGFAESFLELIDDARMAPAKISNDGRPDNNNRGEDNLGIRVQSSRYDLASGNQFASNPSDMGSDASFPGYFMNGRFVTR